MLQVSILQSLPGVRERCAAALAKRGVSLAQIAHAAGAHAANRPWRGGKDQSLYNIRAGDRCSFNHE